MNRALIIVNAALGSAMLLLTLSRQPAAPVGLLVALALLMVIVWISLEIRTRAIANAINCRIDERERSRRDHAHRLAYWMLSLPVGLFAGFCIARIQRAFESGAELTVASSQLGLLAVLLWLGVFLWISLPTAIIAWTEPAPLDDDRLP